MNKYVKYSKSGANPSDRCAKVGYLTKDDARRAAHGMRQYRCSVCKDWHNTSGRKKASKP